jgi:hypothetical protein
MNLGLRANQCPAPQVPGTHSTLAQYEAGTAPPTSKQQLSGTMQPVVSSKLNRNAAAQDLATRFGSGGHAVCEGLVLSIGTGLSVNYTAGLAMIDGLVEVSAGSKAVDASVSRGWLWLTQAGTIVVELTTAKPVSNCILLGSFVSNGTNVTEVDRSGRVSFVSGVLERETADLDIPTDTPSSAWRGRTKTPSGVWEWDGNFYQLIETPLNRLNVPVGAVELVPTGFQKRVKGARTISGSQRVYGVLIEE